MVANEKIKKPVKVTPIVETMPADLLTPLGVFLALSAESKNCFLLESVEGGETLARYSFIGADPEMIVSGNGKRIKVVEGDKARFADTTFINFVREHFYDISSVMGEDLPSFIGGAIGYLNFSCVEWFEPILSGGAESDDNAAFMFYRSVVAFDHAKQVVKIISLIFDNEIEPHNDQFARALSTNKQIRQTLENLTFPRRRISEPSTEIKVESNFDRSAFEDAVAAGKEFIFAGDCYQVVLSQKFSRPTTASDVSIYRALRSTNPSPYMFLLRFESKSIVGASPEMLVKCTGDHLEYRPIAGTRQRGKTPAEDAALGEEMRRDQKEVAEHLMLVDLGRNDLGRVAEFGTVKVDELMKVEKYSHVQHLVTALSAKLKPELDRFDALAACFPAGTVSGAPKVRSVEIIRQLEPDDRGIYAGAVGYFDYSGNMDTCIAIRTLVLENGVATIQSGAGIVADSIPELEYEETVNKAKALLRAIEIAESGEL
jgi:anthranilate synthase component 1